MKYPSLKTLCACGAGLMVAISRPASAATIDDFNASEGHFGNPPTQSGTTVGLATSSTADRVTTDNPLEGDGHEQLVFIYNGTGEQVRCRFLSGGGSPQNNFTIPVTSGTDGFLGFYLKTTNTGWETAISLDGPANSIVQMDGSTVVPIIADGEWHLYEWDLDSQTEWGPSPAIGGGHGGFLEEGNHTIDSIFFRYTGPLPAGDPAAVNAVFYLDFLAVNPEGSVSNLLANPCVNTSGVLVDGPVGADSDEVVVTSVSALATEVKVYQDAGAGAVLVGSKSTEIAAGVNLVPVSGLIKGAQVYATQVVAGQESCLPTTGILVGGGANPSVRVALSIRETTGTGPIGDPNPDASSSLNIHFLGATALSGGAPVDAPVIYPSNEWQTVTFYRGPIVTIGDPTEATFAFVDGAGYDPFNYVSVQVYAFRDIPENGTRIFSATPATSLDIYSNDVFQVMWSWTAVPEADGYRVLRNVNFGGFYEYLDVTNATSLADANTGWIYPDPEAGPIPVTPNSAQVGRSVKWNAPTGDPAPAGTTNSIPGDWGILEAIAFSIHNEDPGPFDFYIDTIQNGTTVFQTFDDATPGAVDVGFRLPNFSGSTSAGLLASPNIGEVSDNAADTGLNSFRVSYQWNGTNVSKWLRLTTSGVGNPMVNLNEPISFKLLLLPVGATPPSSAPGPISVTRNGNDVILDWTGTYYLEAADAVDGTYTEIAGPIAGPYTVTIEPGAKFFRLRK